MNPIIELFRGIGAWMVLTTHYARFFEPYEYILKFLWTGVFLFFVISGFVFGRLILYGQAQGRSYCIKRFFRIYPLYLVSLISYYFLVPDHVEKPVYFFKHLFLLNTTTSMTEAFFFNPAYWTLPVEVEFYILILVLIFLRKKVGEKSIYILLCLSLVLKFIIALNSDGTGDSGFTVLNVHIISMFPEFGVGILLYKCMRVKSLEKKWCLGLFFILGSLLICFCAAWFVAYGNAGISGNLFLKAYFTTLCALGYALILFVCLKKCRPSAAAAGACLKIGATSYGVYLFHNLFPHVFDRLDILIQGTVVYITACLGTLCLAILANRYIEMPFRDFGRRLAKTGIGRKGKVRSV